MEETKEKTKNLCALIPASLHKDVCTAVYYADRSSYDVEAQRRDKLLDHLDGKELSPEQTQPPPTMTMGQTMG